MAAFWNILRTIHIAPLNTGMTVIFILHSFSRSLSWSWDLSKFSFFTFSVRFFWFTGTAKSIDMFSAFCWQWQVLSFLDWSTGYISNYQRFYFFNWPGQILVCSIKMQSLVLFPIYPTQSSSSGYSSSVKSVIKLHTVLPLFPYCLQ